MGQNRLKKNSDKGKVRNAIIVIAVITIVGMLAARFIYSIPLNNPPIRSDGQGYYMYLPAFFIYHDPEMHFIDGLDRVDAQDGTYYQTESGAYVDKYTMGTALLQSPFFLIAHLATLVVDKDGANGFTALYQWFNIISAAFWFFVGAFFSYKIASKYTEEKNAIWAVALCTFGSNLFHFFSYDACFSHVYSFALISIFIWLIIQVEQQEDKTWKLFILGLIYGFIMLVRVTDATVIILYGLFGVTSGKMFVDRMKKIFNPKRLLLPIAGAVIAFLPQMLYWLRTAGKLFLNSYGETDQGFIYWYCPKVLNVLFLVNKGIFFWCPLLLFFVVFAVIQRKKIKELFLPFIVFFLVYVYVVSSWWAYEFAGGFAHRIFVNIMSLFILFGSLAIERIREMKAVIRYTLYGVITLMICWTMVLMFAYWYYVVPFAGYTMNDIANAFRWFFG